MKVRLFSIDELHKSTVKGFIRYRKGHLETVRTYERMSQPIDKPISLPPDIKRKLNSDVHEVVKATHFDAIPLQEIFDALKKHGVVPVSEDNTEWSGFLLGTEGQIYVDIAPVGSSDLILPIPEERKGHLIPAYKPFKNAKLALSWYKMPSGRYEVLSYVV